MALCVSIKYKYSSKSSESLIHVSHRTLLTAELKDAFALHLDQKLMESNIGSKETRKIKCAPVGGQSWVEIPFWESWLGLGGRCNVSDNWNIRVHPRRLWLSTFVRTTSPLTTVRNPIHPLFYSWSLDTPIQALATHQLQVSNGRAAPPNFCTTIFPKMSFSEALSEQAQSLQIILDHTPTSILILFVVTGCAVIAVSVRSRNLANTNAYSSS